MMNEIIEKGEITATIETSFSIMDITKPELFPSLLYYYGLLTIIKGTNGSQIILGIPNNNARKHITNTFRSGGTAPGHTDAQDYYAVRGMGTAEDGGSVMTAGGTTLR